MHSFSVLFASLIVAALSVPVGAQEIDEQTGLLLDCGAGYLLIAQDKSIAETEEEAEQLRNVGLVLLERADATLSSAGMSLEDREKVGADRTLAVAEAFANGGDTGFTPEQCKSLIDAIGAEQTAQAGGGEVQIPDEVDALMTCGAGFYYTAQIQSEAGEADTAKNLQGLGENLLERADDLLVEAGLSEKGREQLGELYGTDVKTKIDAGQDLAYSWDHCAELAY